MTNIIPIYCIDCEEMTNHYYTSDYPTDEEFVEQGCPVDQKNGGSGCRDRFKK